MRIASALLSFAIVVLGAPDSRAFQESSLTGYAWSGADGESWARSGWRPIDTARLSGVPGAEEIDGPCGGSVSFLRREGGLMCHAMTLRVAGGASVTTPDQLRQLLSPIDSAAKTVTLVALLESDLLVEANRLVGHVRETPDGWAVQVVRKHTFGCGDHRPAGVVFRVSRDGRHAEVASEIKPPFDRSQGVVCVD